MNGTLTSKACNCVLDLITGYSGGERPEVVDLRRPAPESSATLGIVAFLVDILLLMRKLEHKKNVDETQVLLFVFAGSALVFDVGCTA